MKWIKNERKAQKSICILFSLNDNGNKKEKADVRQNKNEKVLMNVNTKEYQEGS